VISSIPAPEAELLIPAIYVSFLCTLKCSYTTEIFKKEFKQSINDWSYKVWMENLLKKGLKFNNKMMEK